MKQTEVAFFPQTVEEADDSLKLPVGVPPVLGDYRLVRFIKESPSMIMYQAVQQSVDRSVVLQLLKPEACEDLKLRDDFKKLARAKASLIHPNVAPVYELLKSGNIFFYTGALLPGRNLDQLAKAGRELSTEQVLQIMITVGDSMVAIKSLSIAHRPLKGTDIHLDEKDQAHMANLALPDGAPNASRNEGIGLRKFIRSLQGVAPKGIASDLIASLIELADQRVLNWNDLLSKTRMAGKRYNIGQANRLTHAKGLATSFLRKKHRKRRFTAVTLVLGAFVALIAFTIALPEKTGSKARIFDAMVSIRAGTVTIDGDTHHLDSFWLDAHEVTIGQYARFLDEVGVGLTPYDHTDQPAAKTSHTPKDWEILLAKAKKGALYRDQPIDLNCPVFLVDWWDAYAYASWRGRRLPSSMEWIKAGRGEKENLYPWGDTPPTGQANLGSDYRPDAQGGENDGFNYWAPVDDLPRDISDFGAFGMAGNVEEWTGTWVNHPDYPDQTTPVVCGASFTSAPTRDLSQIKRADSPEETLLIRGFRTASSFPPSPSDE